MPCKEPGLLPASGRLHDRYMRVARRAACHPTLAAYMTFPGLGLGENMAIFMPSPHHGTQRERFLNCICTTAARQTPATLRLRQRQILDMPFSIVPNLPAGT